MHAQEEFQLYTSSQNCPIQIKCFGEIAYGESHAAMKQYAAERAEEDSDQIWLLEHPAVYTQGTACEMATLLPSDIPVVKTDRGGQITYHGPGQIVMYPLLHLKNHGIGIKKLVFGLEQCVIDLLQEWKIDADRREDAPGVYVDQAKIAALGLRIRRGNSYHGLSFNVNMDLTPFQNIDPCGYQGLQVAQLASLGVKSSPLEIGKKLAAHFVRQI